MPLLKLEAMDGVGVDSSPLQLVKTAAVPAIAKTDRALPRDLLPGPLDPLRESCDFNDL